MKRTAILFTAVVVATGLALWWSSAGTGSRVPAAARAFESAADRRPADAGPTSRTAAPPTPERSSPAGALRADPVVISPASLLPSREQDVASPVDGIVDEVLVELGQAVSDGETLARLDAAQVRPQVELLRLRAGSDAVELIAKAQFDEADGKVKYAEKANAAGVASVPELEYKTYVFQRERFAQEVRRAREERAAAARELERAEQVLKQHELRARLRGVVVKVYKRPGEAVKQAEPVFRVASYERLVVEGLCKGAHAGALRVGMPALIEPETRGEQITGLAGHTGAVAGLAVSPDGAVLASAGEDRSVILWDWARGGRTGTLAHPAEVGCVAFAGRDRLISGAGDGRVRAWDVTRGDDAARVFSPAHEGPVRAVAVSGDGRWLASGADDRRIGLWDLTTGAHVRWLAAEPGFPAHQGAVTSLAFTPDGALVSAGRDNVLRVWDVARADRPLVGAQAGRTGEVAQLGVSPDGRRVLFDHGDELRLLDRGSWSSAGSLRNPRQGRFQGVALFSPSGRFVLTGATNGRAQLWVPPVPRETAALLRDGHRTGFHPGALSAVLGLGALTPRDALVSLAPRAVVAPLWDLGGREVRFYATGGGLSAAAFAPDERVFFTAGADRVVHVWAVPADGGSLRALPARVTYVGGQIERGTDAVRVRAELDNPGDSPLRPGGQVHLKLYPEAAR